MEQPNLVELAKQGNPQAIAALINSRLKPKGITAKVVLKEHCLQVILESNQVPDQQTLVKFVYSGIANLKIDFIKTLKIFGKKTDEELPTWIEELQLQVSAEASSNAEIVRAGGSQQEPSKVARNLESPPESRINKSNIDTTAPKEKQKFKWYETDSPPLIIGLLIIFFPLGLWSMWKYANWTLKTKAIITGVISVLVIANSLLQQPSNQLATSDSSSTSFSSTEPAPANRNSGKVGSELCIKSFNTLMPGDAEASLNKDTKTLSINLTGKYDPVTQEEFETITQIMADAVFKACSDYFVQTVEVNNSSYKGTKQR